MSLSLSHHPHALINNDIRVQCSQAIEECLVFILLRFHMSYSSEAQFIVGDFSRKWTILLLKWSGTLRKSNRDKTYSFGAQWWREVFQTPQNDKPKKLYLQLLSRRHPRRWLSRSFRHEFEGSTIFRRFQIGIGITWIWMGYIHLRLHSKFQSPKRRLSSSIQCM